MFAKPSSIPYHKYIKKKTIHRLLCAVIDVNFVTREQKSRTRSKNISIINLVLLILYDRSKDLNEEFLLYFLSSSSLLY